MKIRLVTRFSADCVGRGGSWYNDPAYAKLVLRHVYPLHLRRDYLGFRLILVEEQ